MELLTTLIEPYPQDAGTTHSSELLAVASRAKGMAMHLISQSAVRDGNQNLETYMAEALGLGLHVVIQPIEREDGARVYCLYPEELWRVRAHASLSHAMDTFEHGWNPAVEAIQSSLLGYTDDQVRAWQAELARKRAPSGATVFLLLSEHDRASVARTGSRCLPPDATGVIAFAPTNRVRLRESAWSLVGDRCIARCGVTLAGHELLFERPLADPLAVTELDEAWIARFNAELRTNLEVLGADGWRPAQSGVASL